MRSEVSTVEQDTIDREYLAYFVPKKIQKKFTMQLFSADASVFKTRFFFDPENMKKPPSKVAYNRPPTFFYVLARLPKRPRNRNPVPPKAP